MLKDRSLSSYYDEVALRGLRLARADSARGGLTGNRIERVSELIRSLIEDLDEYEDRAPGQAKLPPRWRGATPVMCLAGCGPLDEAASLMLAQLLRKHGLGDSVVPHEVGSRPAIGALDGRAVAMVCVSYLELVGSPSHLRYLLRRLRQRLPEVLILMGFWPANEEILRDDRMRAAVGADYYTSSLHDAVEACLEAANKATWVNQVTGA